MSDATQESISFEQALEELEQIVGVLEDGTTNLEDSLAKYEKGVGLLKLCYGQLRQTELRIQQLTGETADGQPLIQRFDHAATANTKGR
jgi:exodeoxyribonuclease VII small subunit